MSTDAHDLNRFVRVVNVYHRPSSGRLDPYGVNFR